MVELMSSLYQQLNGKSMPAEQAGGSESGLKALQDSCKGRDVLQILGELFSALAYC